MQPGDANIAGNVHGGTILQMIEEAGLIVSTRHCNLGNKNKVGPLCALARVEKTDFLQPMFVGEIAHLHAQITFCSEHSLEVKVTVDAENLFTGVKRRTNKATLWYVPVISDEKDGVKVCKVPPMEYPSEEAKKTAISRYQKQKAERKKACEESPSLCDNWATSIQVPQRSPVPYTVSNAESTLIHLVGVQDCGLHGRALAGVTMKLMDEVAGICAVRHCRSSALTASMDTVDFHESISKGSLLHIRGRPIFSSNKSLLIQVVVMVEQHKREEAGGVSVFRACTAFFTYVSVSAGKILPVPALQLLNDDERARFEEGNQRYEKNKQARATSAQRLS